MKRFNYIILLIIITVLLTFFFTCATQGGGSSGGGDDNSSGQIPSVTTTSITGNLTFTVDIAGTSAIGGGNVTVEGDSAVIERGVCWNTSGSPTINDSYDVDGLGSGVFTNASITGLTVDTTYHVRAYAINNQGTAYGNEITFNSGKTFGTDHVGGYVFYNNGSGGGLVSAKSDQSISQVWIEGGSTQTTLNGNTATAIDTGLTNSNAIVIQSGHTGSAAQVCLNYDDGTYNDWFLPSRDELNLMYTKLKVNGVGGFANAYYWSSSEGAAYSAWLKSFTNGSEGTIDKDNDRNVRAIRVF